MIITGLDTDFEDGTNVAEALKVVDDLYEKEIRNKNKIQSFDWLNGLLCSLIYWMDYNK